MGSVGTDAAGLDDVASKPFIEFSRLAAGIDVSEFEEAGLQALLADVRGVQRCLDGLVMRIGVRSNHLAARGRAAPAEETARGGGTVGARQARREAARANAAETTPELCDAVSTGRMSGEHVDSVARHLARLTDQQRAELDVEDLIQRAAELPIETFDRLVKRRVDDCLNDGGLADTKGKQAASEFRHWFDRESGMGKFSGSLDPERYEAFTNAIDQHMASIAAASDDPATKSANLAARALVELVSRGAGGGGDGRSGGRGDSRNRLPSIIVVVDHQTAAEGRHARSVRQTEGGHDMADETITRLCCDAVIRRVTLDENGIPINVGRKYRTATDAQWAAIKALHSSCAWESCSAPINWCQAHHVREWEHGGPTDLDNLVPLCSQHHHRVHEGHWQIKLLPDRTLKIYKPDGTHHCSVPPPGRC